ncbi:MAG TPA: hypothetical protein DEO70_00510 [Bacteroidales bacterium]|nr:MAG: hypothetical protein A2X11_03230 [Bacteroidetes bacterium GWE2_42_24]OFY30425.1 MAG: hypothetical protein A2X09_12615 [Bacteroidetes bacterium GWF2_43_11]HBZ65290.1 hypothetical protein [Bacteroidales bacterium]
MTHFIGHTNFDFDFDLDGLTYYVFYQQISVSTCPIFACTKGYIIGFMSDWQDVGYCGVNRLPK